MRALLSCSYLLVVGQPPGHVSPVLWLGLVATGLQHSMHGLKKKKKRDLGEDNPANVQSDA